MNLVSRLTRMFVVAVAEMDRCDDNGVHSARDSCNVEREANSSSRGIKPRVIIGKNSRSP